MSNTNPARGMRDFLPADVRKREYVINTIKEVYESYGYEPLETPAVENIETLMGKYGEEGNQLIFKILKRGEKLAESLGSPGSLGSLGSEETSQVSALPKAGQLADLALRYDLTVPLARVVADRRNELPKFFKRYQIQPVWRADRPARGRFREFYQCDVDAIGSTSIVVEAELLEAVSRILLSLGFKDADFRVLLNHRMLLQGLLDKSDIPLPLHNTALVAMDKLGKVSEGIVKKEMLENGIPESSAEKLRSFISNVTQKSLEFPDDKPSEVNSFVLREIRRYISGHKQGEKAADETERILELTKRSVAQEHVLLTPALARGLSYYTGAIIETYAVTGDFRGSLGGGGRYDGLIGMFGKEQIPACGFSLGLERILVVMDERGMFPPEIAESRAADVMVTLWSDDTAAESLKLASELRSKGLRVTVYPEADKLGKQIKYADLIGVPYVCVLGDSELAENKVTLKNMKTGEQQKMDRVEIVKIVRER